MSELVETIESINENLLRAFGTEIMAGSLPKFRVVFADDELEKRLMTHTDDGFELLYPEVREVKKYSDHIYKGFYILERLVPVAGSIEEGTTDLTTKVSYEPAWVFRDKHGNYLPPLFDMCVFVAESMFAAAMRAGTHVKYKDPALDPELRKKELDSMMEKLFGEESDVADALHYREGVVVPRNYENTAESNGKIH